MDIKNREVMQWLKELYPDQPIPNYEKTERNIEILHDLMNKNKNADRDAKLLHDDFDKKSLEYEADSKLIKGWMENLNLQPNSLSTESQKILSTIVHLQNTMDLNSPSTTNMFLGLNELETKTSQVSSEILTEKRRMINLLSLNQKLAKKLQELQVIYESSSVADKIKKEELEKGKRRHEFNIAKMEEYKQSVKNYEAKLNHIGYKENLAHDKLVKKSVDVEALENKVIEQEKNLTSYTLPPDILLAQAKVEEARHKLNGIFDGIASVYKPT